MTHPETMEKSSEDLGARYDILERFIRGKHVEDLEGASRQARSASEQLNKLRWQAQFAALPPERQAEWERIAAGEHVPLPDDPEPTPCPDWCDGETHLPERHGTVHVGASAMVLSTFSTPDNPRTAQTYAYVEDGRGMVYAGDQDLIPAQAREYAAAVVRAAELAERIGAGA